LSLHQSIAESGWTQSHVSAAIIQLLERKQIVRCNDRLISAQAFTALASRAVALVGAFQKSNPLSPGIGREVLREQLNCNAEIFSAVVDTLAQQKTLEAAADQLRVPGTGVVMKDEEAESKKVIENAFASAGLKAPALKDVLAGLKVDRVRGQRIVTLLLRDKVLVKTSEDLVFHRAALEELRKKLQVERTKSPKIDIARFKGITGVSRKYAIPLLEYLDREHITRRVGDERIILEEPEALSKHP
jgi:selenocysteine-specific elongation factor